MGGLATVVVLTVYLSRVNRNHRVNDNEAFSGRHFTDAKHFLRCHIGPTGTLTVRLIGIDTIQPEWAAAIEAGDTLPPKAPEGPNLVGMVEWTETVRRQVDPIPFVRDANRWVALSVSDPAGSTADEVAERHLLVEAIAEALLDAGCNIAYGGDNRLGGYDRTLAGAAARTADLRLARVRRYVRAASPSARTAPGVETVRVPAPVGALDDEYADRRWLTAMRELVSDQCFARVVVGGRASGTSLPGVIEEGAISFGRGQALLVVGGSGGAASALAAAIRGAVMPHDIGVASIAALGALQPTDGQPVDLHNGLTPEENQELLTTKELHRIVYLVVQGMRVTAIGGRPSSGTA